MNKTATIFDKSGLIALQLGMTVEVQTNPYWYGEIVDIEGREGQEKVEVEGLHEPKREWVSVKDVVAWKGKTEGSKRTAMFNKGDRIKFVGDFPAGSVGEKYRNEGSEGVVQGEGYDPDYFDLEGNGPTGSDGQYSVLMDDGYDLMVPEKNLEKVASMERKAVKVGDEVQVLDTIEEPMLAYEYGNVVDMNGDSAVVEFGEDTLLGRPHTETIPVQHLKVIQNLGPEPDPFAGPSGMFVGASKKTAAVDSKGQELKVGDMVRVLDFAGETVEAEVTSVTERQIQVSWVEDGMKMATNIWTDGRSKIEKVAAWRSGNHLRLASKKTASFVQDEIVEFSYRPGTKYRVTKVYNDGSVCDVVDVNTNEKMEAVNMDEAASVRPVLFGEKTASELTDAVGEPILVGDKVLDTETDEEGDVIEVSGIEAFIEWLSSGRQEWTTGDMLVKAMKKVADEPAATEKAEEVMGIGAYISATEAAKDASQKQYGYQTGMILKEEPFASQFLERVKQEVGPISEEDAEVLEWNNFHTELELLRGNGLVRAASKKEALYFEDEIMDEDFPEEPDASPVATAPAVSHSFAVGDILHGSFGYDETHNYFAEVTGLVGSSTLLVRPIAAEQVGEHEDAFSYRVRPVPGKYIGPEARTRVSRDGNHAKVPVQHLSEMLSASKCNPSETFYASSGFH